MCGRFKNSIDQKHSTKSAFEANFATRTIKNTFKENNTSYNAGLSVEPNHTESLCAFDIGYQSEVSKHPLLQRSTYYSFYITKDNFKTVICAALIHFKFNLGNYRRE